MKNKTLICMHSAGNHSNRLFQNIHFQAFCLENNIIYKNPTFKDMQKLYPCSSLKTKKTQLMTRWGGG